MKKDADFVNGLPYFDPHFATELPNAENYPSNEFYIAVHGLLQLVDAATSEYRVKPHLKVRFLKCKHIFENGRVMFYWKQTTITPYECGTFKPGQYQ